MDDIKRALLGDKEAAKRLTETGYFKASGDLALCRCPFCGSEYGQPFGWAMCSACGEYLTASDEYPCIGHFCPNCGAPMTDKAVEMVMERLEALHSETKAD